MIKQTLALALGKSQTRRDHRLARRLGHYEWLEDRRVLASLSGHVINDLNGNGQIEVGEPGLGGVEVFLDQNGNDMLDITGLIVEPDAFDSTELIDTSVVEPASGSGRAGRSHPSRAPHSAISMRWSGTSLESTGSSSSVCR